MKMYDAAPFEASFVDELEPKPARERLRSGHEAGRVLRVGRR
jgi:hypothetical protein